jgi:hypothetical protein
MSAAEERIPAFTAVIDRKRNDRRVEKVVRIMYERKSREGEREGWVNEEYNLHCGLLYKLWDQGDDSWRETDLAPNHVKRRKSVLFHRHCLPIPELRRSRPGPPLNNQTLTNGV